MDLTYVHSQSFQALALSVRQQGNVPPHATYEARSDGITNVHPTAVQRVQDARERMRDTLEQQRLSGRKQIKQQRLEAPHPKRRAPNKFFR